MQTSTIDTLAQELHAIEATCTEHHIQPFYGQLEVEQEEEGSHANGKEPNGETLDRYLQLLVKAAPSVLILDIERYKEESDESILSLVADYKKTLEGKRLQDYNTALEQLRLHEGQVISYTLSFQHSCVWYHFERDAEWRTHYDTFTDAYAFVADL